VVILSAVRTPVGAFQSSLASVPATQLGATAVSAALSRASLSGADVDEVFLGNVNSANLGQCPATQAAAHGGIPFSVPSTTVNKVCSSGLKAVVMSAQSIQTKTNRVCVAGGFESMSNVPYYLPKARTGYGLGHGEVVDGLIKDGLWDAFDNHHMGMAAEQCAIEYSLSRQMQDEFALESYRRAQFAQANGLFKDEITPVIITGKKGDKKEVTDDEEPAKLIKDKVSGLRGAFKKDGTVTAANASKLNDGASALVVASGDWARSRGLKAVARIIGYADAQKRPVDFTTAPSLVIPRALASAGIDIGAVDFFEINEAFSAVALANIQILNLDPAKVNVHGGAVALGHPLGSSGSRILVTLIHILKQRKGRIGVAAICNGGGGATAVVVEAL